MTHLLSEGVFLLERLHEHIHDQVKMADVLSLFVSQTSQLVLVAQGSGFSQLCGTYVHVECSTEKWVGQCHITCMYEVTCFSYTHTHTQQRQFQVQGLSHFITFISSHRQQLVNRQSMLKLQSSTFRLNC